MLQQIKSIQKQLKSIKSSVHKLETKLTKDIDQAHMGLDQINKQQGDIIISYKRDESEISIRVDDISTHTEDAILNAIKNVHDGFVSKIDTDDGAIEYMFFTEASDTSIDNLVATIADLVVGDRR